MKIPKGYRLVEDRERIGKIPVGAMWKWEVKDNWKASKLVGKAWNNTSATYYCVPIPVELKPVELNSGKKHLWALKDKKTGKITFIFSCNVTRSQARLQRSKFEIVTKIVVCEVK